MVLVILQLMEIIRYVNLISMKTAHVFRICFLLLVTVAAVALVLFGTEYFFKLLQYQKITHAFQTDRFIRIRNLLPNSHPVFKPSIVINKKDSFDLEVKDYQSSTDSLGFIVTNLNHVSPDLKFAFFGSSTIQCLFVEEDKRMPEAVTRAVEKKTGMKINVWNCAAGGTHSYHTLNMFNNLAINLNTDYAFFYGNVNDVSVLMHYGTYNNPNIDKGLFFTIEGYQKKNNIPLSGALPYTTDALKTWFHLKPEVDDFGDARGLPLILDSAVIIPQVIRVFKTIVASCKANQVKPVIITQRLNFDKLSYSWLLKNMPYFTPTEEEYEKVKWLFHQYNNALRLVAKEEKVILIDLDSMPLGFEDFYDAVHFNTKVSVVVSEEIATQFLKKTKEETQQEKSRSSN